MHSNSGEIKYELIQVEERMRSVVDHVVDGIISIDESGTVTTYNRAAERIFGYTASEVIGQNVKMLMPEPFHGEHDSYISNYLRTGQAKIIGIGREVVGKRKDGVIFPMDLAISVFSLAGRRQFTGIVRDITERKRAEEELRSAEERMRSVVNHVVDGIITIDESGQVESFNPAAEKLFGYKSGEVIGRNVKMLMPEPFHGEHDGYIANYLRTGHAKIIGIGREVVGRRKDESTFPMELAVSAFQIGKRRYFTGIVRDITERRKAEEALRANAVALKEALTRTQRATRAKDEFLATVSHELRTPLTAMHGWAQMIQDGKLDESQNRHGMNVIMRNIRAQTKLIEDLLDVSRIIAGKLQLRIQSVNLEQVVTNAVESMRSAADARGIRIDVKLQPIHVPVDPDRLQQVLWNLLSNALKFTEKRVGKVAVRMEVVASQVQIVVADNGKGIKSEFQTSLFERFTQEDSSSTREYGGLGLGLSIAKHLVEAHGGKISAESEGEGKGAAFIICLPIPPLSRTTIGSPVNDLILGNQTRLDSIRVLVVEDDADSRDLLIMVIENAGAMTVNASSARNALALLQTFTPDIILSDIGMPGMDGYELIRSIRVARDGMFKSIPAIALTAYASDDDRMRAIEAGYQAHATKPFDAGRLIALIANLAGVKP